MKKYLILFIIIGILFSFAPQSEAGNFVKSIDAFFVDLQLSINGDRIPNHRGVFVHNGEFYVSLEDLCKALDLKLESRASSIYLDSQGKLDFDKDLSKNSLVFQRGYEIYAKEKIVENLNDEIRKLQTKGKFYKDYDLKGEFRGISVGFGDVTIFLDKNPLDLDIRPILYNDNTYVSLYEVSPYLFVTPSLSRDKTIMDIDSNGVLVQNPTHTSIDNLFYIREGRNYLLDLKMEELKSKKYIIDELKLPYGKISDAKSLKDYLNKNFGKIGDLKVEIDLVQQHNWINLNVNFSSQDTFNWYKLKRSDVENWVWNIYSSILNLYDDNILISGAIRNPFYSNRANSSLKNYVTFTSRNNDIFFDFTKSRLSLDDKVNPGYLMEILNKDLSEYEGIKFRYETDISGGNLILTIYTENSSFKGVNIYTKMGYLNSLKKTITDLYPNLTVEGTISTPKDILPCLSFYFEENRIRSRDLLDDTEDYLNATFDRFSHRLDDFKLDYNIYELDLRTFELIVTADFSIDDDKWKSAGNTGLQSLSQNVHNALNYIFSLWDANVSTEVLDKEGRTILEFDTYNENVAIVSADPSGGEILEGSKIYLSSDTPGARIYYTTDGSSPTTSSNVYNPLGIYVSLDGRVDNSLQINAFGYKDGIGSGPISSFEYTIEENKNISKGLNTLKVNGGNLEPSFKTDIKDYIIWIEDDVSEIELQASANGEVTLDNLLMKDSFLLQVKDGKKFTINVSEVDKLPVEYKFAIRSISDSSPEFVINELEFTTIFDILKFNGKLSTINDSIDNFKGYKIHLYTKTNLLRASVTIDDSKGYFSFDTIILDDPFDKFIGFKYVVEDPNGKDYPGTELKSY